MKKIQSMAGSLGVRGLCLGALMLASLALALLLVFANRGFE